VDRDPRGTDLAAETVATRLVCAVKFNLHG